MCDIWALGVLFFRMSFGLYPFNAYSREKLILIILNGCLLIPKRASTELENVFENILQKNPLKRYSLKSIIARLELL